MKGSRYRNMKRHFLKYVLFFVVFVAAWGLIELIFKQVYVYLPARHRNGKRIVEVNLGRPDEIPASIHSHPYLLYFNTPNYQDSIKQHNSMGYRSGEILPEKPEETFRILALGGSTTYGYLNKDPSTTWPSLLQKKLRDHFSTEKIEVINAGLNYATSAELLAGYVFRHRYLNPDVVIFHEGGNDAVPVFFDAYTPEYTHFRAHGSGAYLRRYEKILLHSNVFKVFYSLWLNNLETVYRSQPYSLSKLNRGQVEKYVKDETRYRGFMRNVELLIRLAQLDSADVLLFGFIQAREENLARNRPDLIGLEKSLIRAVNKNNDILKTLASAHKVTYLEAKPSVFKDEWFLDNCHLNEKGEEMKASLVFDEVVKMMSPVIAGQ